MCSYGVITASYKARAPPKLFQRTGEIRLMIECVIRYTNSQQYYFVRNISSGNACVAD